MIGLKAVLNAKITVKVPVLGSMTYFSRVYTVVK